MNENTTKERPELPRLVMRIGDIELRTCDICLTTSGEHVKAEIVKWHNEGNACHTIASWRESESGFDLNFVGGLPFEVCNGREFWRLARTGQDHLDSWLGDRDV